MGISLYRISAAASILFVCGLCGLCGWRSLKLALGTTSDNAEYYLSSGDPDRAVSLNPHYTAAWIARGLEAEAAGDRKKAEASLRQAAEIDRTYLPRWTLANFYLRAGDKPNFWTWARRAVEMAYDPGALFQLCWRVSSDAREIQARAIPPDPAARRAYFDFLVRTNRLEAAELLANELERTADRSDLNRLLGFCDVELARNQVRPARNAWNALAASRLVPQGAPLTNGDLSTAPIRHCFDWLTNAVDGASLSFGTAHEMELSVSGRQPEMCDFIQQYVPVEPGAAYRFRFRVRTALAGLRWTFIDARTAGEFSVGPVSLASDGWREQTVAISVPAGCEILRIILSYRRPAGTVRAEGEAVFTGFTLERAG